MTDGLSESLDYEPVQNRAYMAALQGATRRRFYGMIKPSGTLPPHRPLHVLACAPCTSSDVEQIIDVPCLLSLARGRSTQLRLSRGLHST